MDQVRLSIGIARYGGISLRTTQQVVTSSNSDTQVVTSNSTFGTGDNIFTTDSYTSVLINGDENWGGTTTYTMTVGGTGPGPIAASTTHVITNNNTVEQIQGVSAFGANSYYLAGPATSGGDYFKWAHDTSFDMSDTTAFTLECWYMCPQDVSVSESPNFYRSIINLSPITSGTDNSRAGMIALMFNHTGSENFPVYFRT